MEKKYYIGLMSGTSVDSIDAALVDLDGEQPLLVEHYHHDIPDEVRQAIAALCHPGENGVNRLGQTDILVGELFADATLALLKKAKRSTKDIVAIGSHGQTVRHHPCTNPAFTTQIGDPNTIAAKTNITTVADFRRKDIANGGQGAPFVPVFHQMIRHTDKTHIMLNIGGIANLTLLPEDKNASVIGFDTGPGNTLLDFWCHKHKGKACDEGGKWASGGKVDGALLAILLDDVYFKKAGPKSTGREYFNNFWLERNLNILGKAVSAQDVQTTLTELTAKSIADAIQSISDNDVDVIVCGGGVHNTSLISRIQALLAPKKVESSAKLKLDPDGIEAMAFAWFAKQTLEKRKIDLTHITGAKKPAVLGGIYYP
jgi:anhydro-N-acetylmuramic acid kinase